MFARIVSLVQIATIIVCPMWCSSGLCHAGQCCSVKQSAADQVCPLHGTATCCEKSSHEDGVPCRYPNKPCQGICGGAVFEKPIELDDCSATFFLPLIHTDIFFAPQLADGAKLDAEHRCQCLGDNHGRSLRTLYMSYLC